MTHLCILSIFVSGIYWFLSMFIRLSKRSGGNYVMECVIYNMLHLVAFVC
jgi:hypothetical protein